MIGFAAAEIRGYTPPKLNIVMSQVYNFMRVPHIFLLGVKSISSEAQGEGIKMTEEVRLCFMHLQPTLLKHDTTPQLYCISPSVFYRAC